MSKSQRTKGRAFEQEVVREFNEHGLDAERNLSQSRDGGYDIDSLAGAFECKRRASIASYLLPGENVRGQIVRADRGGSYVVLRLSDALGLLAMDVKVKRALIRKGFEDGEPATLAVATEEGR